VIPITAQSTILLAIKPVDFRRQIDGLVAHCQQVLNTDPRGGTLFVFINKARTMIRVLVYEHNGYWVMTKRLSQGTFRGWPTDRQPLSPLNAGALMRLLRGEYQARGEPSA
jgi:hypothetical protein